MQRKTFEECKNNFLIARQNQDWLNVGIWSSELLAHDGSLPYVWANRGIALKQLGHHIDAILNYDKALTLETKPLERAILLNNKGGAYWDLFKKEPALEALNASLEVYALPETFMTLGHIAKYENKLPEAIAHYRNGLKLNPTHADLHLALGMALLKNKELKEGWEHYEWRWKTSQLPERQLTVPKWEGQDLKNKNILVYGEQGLGDNLQFVRYVRVLREKYPTARIIVETASQLQRLFETMPDIYAVIRAGDKIPEVDYAISMISLAAVLTPDYEDIPPSTNEFKINPAVTAYWNTRFNEAEVKGKKIGICWAGMARKNDPVMVAIDNLRSMELMQFAPLMHPGIFWISLQKGEPAAQLKSQETRPRNMIAGDFTEDMLDFYDTCAAISALDLVITVDTAVAHAAASIGKPTWLLSRWDGCWRWFGDGLTNPWYPSMVQFVQHSPHDWSGPIATMARELTTFLKK